MRMLLVLSGLLILFSCSGAGLDQDRKKDLNGRWVLAGLGEKELPEGFHMDSTSRPYLDIRVEDKSYSGSDGCNRIMGGFIELDDRIIRFGVAAGTQMMCPDMEIPDLFNRVLIRVHSWKMKQNQLLLFDEKGTLLMQFRKPD